MVFKRIVILGAGFGGVYVLKRLSQKFGRHDPVEVILVNSRNYFLFTPLLHEVATGNLTPDTVVEPLRAILRPGFSNLYLAEVSSVNLTERMVTTTTGPLHYDYLVLALGSTTNFYQTPGAAEYSFTLKTLSDAIRLKNHFIQAFEAATKLTDEEAIRQTLHFVVIGGGPTGVELAAEMTDFLTGTFKKFYPPYITSEVRITLIQRALTLVPRFSPALQRKSLEVLTKKGVTVHLNRGVTAVGSDLVMLDNGERLPTKTVIWTAGVQPAIVPFTPAPALAADSRIIINDRLQLIDYPEVFALGDLAAYTDKQSGKALPPLAQVATKEGQVVANNIVRLVRGEAPRPFVYHHAGTLMSLGKWVAVGEIRSITFFGRFAWWFWRMVYLSKIISGPKKLKVALDWTIGLFFPRDISEL